jgi:gluconate 2-dehydrogenase gamma chain
MGEEEPRRDVSRAAFVRNVGVGAVATAAIASCGTQQQQQQGGTTAAGNASNPPSPAAPTSPPAVAFAPHFFTSSEENVVAAMAERIFPADANGPGAYDLHVVDYIDRRLGGAYGYGARVYNRGPFFVPQDSGHGFQSPMTPRDIYRDCLASLAAYCQRKYNGTFDSLSAAQQDQVLRDLEKGGIAEFTSMPSQDFLAQVIAHVAEGLFADPMYGGNYQEGGWRFIGFPGDPMNYGDQYFQYVDRPDAQYDVTPKPLIESVPAAPATPGATPSGTASKAPGTPAAAAMTSMRGRICGPTS